MCLMFIDEHVRCVKSWLLFHNEMINLNYLISLIGHSDEI
jgi:hypothetical protein